MKSMNDAEMQEYLKLFKYKLSSKVKFEDVDSFGVVHNIKYLYWMEWARTEYLRDVLFPGHKGNFLLDFPVMVVRNEIDYIGAARFNQEYSILCRIESVGKSSIKFDNVVLLDDKHPIVRCRSVFVHVNSNFQEKRTISKEVIEKIHSFEGTHKK